MKTAENITNAATVNQVFSPVQVKLEINLFTSSNKHFSGTLIFDSVLKICNWPETTTCISDLLLVKPRRDRPKSPGFGRGSQTNTTQYQFSQDVVNALRHVATEAPVIVNVTPANKLSKRILSLFSAKARKRHRNNILSSKASDNRSRSDITQGAFNKHEQVTFRNIHERLTTTRRTTTTTRTTPTTTTRRTTSHSPRFNIKPRIRQNPLLRRRPFTPPPVQSTTSRSQTVTSSAKHDNDDDDDDDDESVAVNVRSESSVSSVSSYVRVSITDLDDQRPFSNGRGGEQFLSETHDDDDYLTRLRQELELSEPSSSAAPAKSAAKPIKCHTGESGYNQSLETIELVFCTNQCLNSQLTARNKEKGFNWKELSLSNNLR